MEIELTNGYVYTIPDKVLRACKYIKIGYSDFDDGSYYPSRSDRRALVFDANEELLKGYIYIGWENFRFHNRSYIGTELHWFIPTNEFDDCQFKPTDQKVYKVRITDKYL